MARFAQTQEVADFLLPLLLSEAGRSGIAWSKFERHLFYHYCGALPPDAPDVEAFESELFTELEQISEAKEQEYENRAVKLIRSAVKRIRKEDPQQYAAFKAAARRLRQEPFNGGFSLIEKARVAPFPWLDGLKLWVSGIALVTFVAVGLIYIPLKKEQVALIFWIALIILSGSFILVEFFWGKEKVMAVLNKIDGVIRRITGLEL